MTEEIKLTGRSNPEGQTKLQILIGIPHAILKIGDEEFRIAIANAKFLTDRKNFISSYKSSV
jgi:hypothetical protein